CVLSAEMAAKLFPLDSPVGRTVRIENRYYKVIGIMERQSSTASENEALDSAAANLRSRIFLPLETVNTHYGEIIFKRRTGSREMEKMVLSDVTVKVKEPGAVIDTSLAIKDLLDRKHKKTDYRMIVPLELLKRAEETKRLFNIVLGSIAAISLLVGGI